MQPQHFQARQRQLEKNKQAQQSCADKLQQAQHSLTCTRKGAHVTGVSTQQQEDNRCLRVCELSHT